MFTSRHVSVTVLLLILISACAAAYGFTYPVIRKSGKNIAAFVPVGWHVLSEANGEKVLAKASGDLNGDTLPDIAMVIECNKDLNATGKEANSPGNQHKPRIFLALFKTQQGGYILSVQSNDLILCADDGGIFGDPFDGLSMKRGTVVVHFYGGSAWRWDITSRFRLQNGGWYLIGLTDLSYHDASGEMREYDYNLLNGRMKITTGNYFKKAQQKSKWKTPGKRKVLLTRYHAWFDGEWQKMADHG